MKKIFVILTAILILTCCVNSRKIILASGIEYWGEHFAGDTTTLQEEYEIYTKGSDTLIHFTNYYVNGALKSKVIMKNLLLLEIESVVDSAGNNLDFGYLKNGNGYVIRFRDDCGGRDEEGLYVDGNREGWWKNYHFTGNILDSLLYIEGCPQFPPPTHALDSLLHMFGPIKNNLYR